MINFLQNHKFLFLLILIIASPIILLWVIFNGVIVGALGGVVWGIQKARHFLLSKHSIDEETEGLIANIFKWIFVIYIFFFISLFAGSICLVIGPFRAYSKLKNAWKYKGNVLKKEKVKPNRPLVLVVDDEVDLAEYVAQKIKSTGKYATVMAHNGLEALQVLQQHERFLGFAENRIGCIVLDIKMPEMDGIQFLQELRKREGALMFKDIGAFHQIPVIILSAYEDIDKISDATHPRLGKSAKYIMKPETPEHYEELLVAINNVFSRDDQEMVANAYLSGSYRINELRNNQE